jgi:RNA-directed DNA polymerase
VNIGAPWPTLSLEEAEARVLGIQTKLHRWATDAPDRRFADLFNLVCDPAVLLVAWRRVRGNKGARTAGVDGQTVSYIQQRRGEESFLAELRADLKACRFAPLPVRERLIPSPAAASCGCLGSRPCGTVRAALKLVLEPIFEADFLPCSYGFRPGRRAQDAIAEIHVFASPHTATSGSSKAISRHASTRSTMPHCWAGSVNASPTRASWCWSRRS